MEQKFRKLTRIGDRDPNLYFGQALPKAPKSGNC